MKLSDYLLQFPEIYLEDLIADDTMSRIRRLLPILGETSPSQFFIECELYKPEKKGDFSVQYTRGNISTLFKFINGDVMRGLYEKSDVWARVYKSLLYWLDDALLFSQIKDFWLEFDHEALIKDPPVPCCFFDAGRITIKDAIDGPLATWLGSKSSESIRKNLDRCVSALEGVELFQLGVMLGRDENPRLVRLFTNQLQATQVIPFLSKSGWGTCEEYERLEDFLMWAEEYSTGLYLIDLGVHKKGLASKIGVEVYLLPGTTKFDNFLNATVKRGLALQEKCDGIRKWMKGDGEVSGMPSFVNSFSHFKFPFDGDFLGAKIYLKQIDMQKIMQSNCW